LALVCLADFLAISRLQGPTVRGEVSFTCDAWQASNTDGYFAVTAHWTRESTPTKWELKSAIIGFTRLNNAHNGVRLGQALFKIIKRVGLEYKVSLCLCHHTIPSLARTHPRACPRLPSHPPTPAFMPACARPLPSHPPTPAFMPACARPRTHPHLPLRLPAIALICHRACPPPTLTVAITVAWLPP